MNDAIGYLRISTEKQDLEKQRHLILEYAHKEKLHITEFIEVEASTQKSSKERRLDYLKSKLKPDSVLVVAELSRLERSMIECINLVMSITELGVEIKFIRQPELNLKGLHGKLILAIFGYFAEAERDYIRLRTKEGLKAARASGKVLGRPKGCKNKNGLALDENRNEIIAYLNMNLPIASIHKIVNDKRDRKVSYNTYYDYVNMLKTEGLEIEIKR